MSRAELLKGANPAPLSCWPTWRPHAADARLKRLATKIGDAQEPEIRIGRPGAWDPCLARPGNATATT